MRLKKYMALHKIQDTLDYLYENQSISPSAVAKLKENYSVEISIEFN